MTALAAMAEHPGKLGSKKEEALVVLLSHRTIDDAARACNIRPRTLYRWLKEPEFAAAYREARRAAFSTHPATWPTQRSSTERAASFVCTS